MTAREWKPGDVAMTAQGTVALCGNSGRFIDQGGAPWSNDKFPNNLRPLVVIDPEDREQVERLFRLLVLRLRCRCGQMLVEPATSCAWHEARAEKARSLRAEGSFEELGDALREFAAPKPPKPEEPTVGALVEDDGVEWGRLNILKAPWHSLDGTGRWAAWGDFSDAVRIVAKGVPS